MPVQIETYRIQQYENNVRLLAQQTKSRFEAVVSGNSYTGEKISPVNYPGKAAMRQQETRSQKKEYDDVPAERRWIMPDNLYYHAILIEKQDQVEALSALENGLASAQMAGANRQKDDVIIRAFFADAKTGKNAETSTPFPSSQKILADVGAAAATGLNYDKIVALGELYMTNDVDLEVEGQITMGIGPKQNSNLLKQAEVIQKKYDVKARIEGGKVMELAGINFVHTTRLLKVGNTRRCPVWTKGGMHLGTWSPLKGTVQENRTLVGHPHEAYADMIVGATRLSEYLVAEVECNE